MKSLNTPSAPVISGCLIDRLTVWQIDRILTRMLRCYTATLELRFTISKLHFVLTQSNRCFKLPQYLKVDVRTWDQRRTFFSLLRLHSEPVPFMLPFRAQNNQIIQRRLPLVGSHNPKLWTQNFACKLLPGQKRNSQKSTPAGWPVPVLCHTQKRETIRKLSTAQGHEGVQKNARWYTAGPKALAKSGLF